MMPDSEPSKVSENRRSHHRRWRLPLGSLVQRVREVPITYRTAWPLYAGDLRRLNDVLSHTSLAARYWVWGGMLLGWARDGSLLAHDTKHLDADFGVLAEDEERFDTAVPVLERAGFRRLYVVRGLLLGWG